MTSLSPCYDEYSLPVPVLSHKYCFYSCPVFVRLKYASGPSVLENSIISIYILKVLKNICGKQPVPKFMTVIFLDKYIKKIIQLPRYVMRDKIAIITKHVKKSIQLSWYILRDKIATFEFLVTWCCEIRHNGFWKNLQCWSMRNCGNSFFLICPLQWSSPESLSAAPTSGTNCNPFHKWLTSPKLKSWSFFLL